MVEMPRDLIPAGKWEIVCVADSMDCEDGLSDMPCYRIHGPDQIDGVIWGRGSPETLLRKFVLDLYGVYITCHTVTWYYT